MTTTINTATSNNTSTMTEDARKALITYLESTILGYDKLNIRKQCGTLTPRQEVRLVSLENMIRSICVVAEANGITLTDTSGYSVAMMNWSEGTKKYYGTHYIHLVKDAVRLTDVESFNTFATKITFTVESTETMVGKIWLETKELVQLSWVFVKDSVYHVWAILRDGSKYLWGKMCDLFTWLVSLFKKKEATTVVPTAGGTVDPTTAPTTTAAPVAASVITPETPVSTASTAPVITSETTVSTDSAAPVAAPETTVSTDSTAPVIPTAGGTADPTVATVEGTVV